MAKTSEKKLALELYMHSSLLQKEIAQRVGVAEHTICKWSKDGGWDNMRSAGQITREALLNKAYRQLDKLNKYIDQEMNGLPDKKTNDAKSTLIREIQALDRHDSLSLYVAVMEKFLLFLSAREPELARAIGSHQLEFLEQRSNEQS